MCISNSLWTNQFFQSNKYIVCCSRLQHKITINVFNQMRTCGFMLNSQQITNLPIYNSLLPVAIQRPCNTVMMVIKVAQKRPQHSYIYLINGALQLLVWSTKISNQRWDRMSSHMYVPMAAVAVMHTHTHTLLYTCCWDVAHTCCVLRCPALTDTCYYHHPSRCY